MRPGGGEAERGGGGESDIRYGTGGERALSSVSLPAPGLRSFQPAPPQLAPMHCFKCGSTISEGSRFCGSCGVQVSDPAAPTLVVATETDPIVEAVRRDLGHEFEIERELGRGGMGVVFRARELDLDRIVALKVLPPDMALHPELAERFRREARLAAALDHPNIIPIYRLGQSGGTLALGLREVLLRYSVRINATPWGLQLHDGAAEVAPTLNYAAIAAPGSHEILAVNGTGRFGN